SQEEYNTKEKRGQTTRLIINRNRLEGKLDLSDFINLELLDCQDNNLTLLNASSCSKLTYLDCHDNLLTNLSFLKIYVNLEDLRVRNNNFVGSLDCLSDMKKLKELFINDTDIDRGLEYLPKSLNTFFCPSIKRPEARVTVKIDKKIDLMTSPLLPPQLIGEISGNKSLRKAVQTCKEAIKDKENEIPKMRQYYSNTELTLIALNDEIGDISNIDLMDVLRKASYTDVGKYNSRSEFNRGTKKIVTPVGWVYYRDGYSKNDKVEMTLSQALKAIKNRGRGIPIDGIYSILEPIGYALPEYYPIEVIKENLSDGRKVVEYREKNENGSTNIEGGMDIKIINDERESMIFKEEGIGLCDVTDYIIKETSPNIHKLEGVKVKDEESNEIIEVPLLGTQDTLNLAEKDKYLVVFDIGVELGNEKLQTNSYS
ncbi:20038_t:CDS:10, partial [Funneliformis geosporum]